jgi:hypothetical protein
MTNSFKAFMEKIIDYAGLFPPARLPLDKAVHEYIRHKQEPESWMLNRFICPAQKLSDLLAYNEEFNAKSLDLPLTVLLGNVGSQSDFLFQFEKELKRFYDLEKKGNNALTVNIFEMRLSRNLFDNFTKNQISQFLTKIQDLMLGYGYKHTTLFLELEQVETIKEDLLNYFQTIKEFQATSNLNLGVKLRCGGEAAEAFPAPEKISEFLALCVKTDIPIKATAGLHHPVRHFNTSINTKMHGFFNVFGAALLAFRHQLDSIEINKIIQEENTGHFLFANDVFSWKNLEISTSNIQNLRNTRVIGFGSCSFDEPREDLKTLGLL